MTIAILVPARIASTRFPQKLLHEIHGKPVILWTAERIRSEAPEDVARATTANARRLFRLPAREDA